MTGAARGRQTGSKRLILPDTCPDQGSGWNFRRSRRYGRRSVKPSAQPTLVRTRHLPLLLARGSRRDQDPLSAATQRIKALQALLSRHIAAHLGMPGSIPQRERSTQKPDQCRRARTVGSGCPQPAGQSSSAAYRTAGLCAGARRLKLLSVTDGLRGPTSPAFRVRRCGVIARPLCQADLRHPLT